MQKIEEKIDKSNRDVITISGLVISKLCRLENECKSVLNLWEPTTYSKVEEEARTPIENAVIKCDIKLLDSLLKNGTNYINEQDSNGWTILHLSCSFCFNQTRLEVCKYLLEMEEMDPLIVNNYGNIALHYLVRLPIKEHEKPLFLQVIKMMLRNTNTAFIANNRGETPLHSSILASNYLAAEEILKASADPNFGNVNGDTSLHYAVQAQSKELVNLLLLFGAQVDVKNNNGETPTDIAYKLNSIDIVEILTNYKDTPNLQAEAQKRKLLRERTNQQLIQSKENQAMWSQKSSTVSDENIKWTKPSIPAQLLAEIENIKSRGDQSPPQSPRSVPPPPLPSRELKTALRVQSMKLEIPVAPPKEFKKNQSHDDSNVMQGAANKIATPAPKFSTLRVTKPPTPLSPKPSAGNIEQDNRSLLKPISDKPANSSVAPSLRNSAPTKIVPPKRKALWSKTKDSPNELALEVGDIIIVTNQDPSGWWTGRIDNREGIFPANYTEEYTDQPAKFSSHSSPTSPITEPQEKKSRPLPSVRPLPTPHSQSSSAKPNPITNNHSNNNSKNNFNNNHNNSINNQNNQNSQNSQNMNNLNNNDHQKYPGVVKGRASTVSRRPLPPPPEAGKGNQPVPARRPLPPCPGLEIAELLADFEAETETEISLQKGAVVQVIKREEGWCLVNFNGTRGYCPESYLKQK